MTLRSMQTLLDGNKIQSVLAMTDHIYTYVIPVSGVNIPLTVPDDVRFVVVSTSINGTRVRINAAASAGDSSTGVGSMILNTNHHLCIKISAGNTLNIFHATSTPKIIAEYYR